LTLIIIDGLDGSGKSTQALQIKQSLQNQGKTVLLRVHPENDNLFGVRARQFLLALGKSAHFAAALFYMVDVVRSILLYSWQKVDYIIFVRYLMGTAYLPSPLHKISYHFFALVIPKPEFMLFLDVKPQEAASRITRSRSRTEMFEGVDSLKKVRAKALTLTFSGKWIIVDANRSKEEVSSAIRHIVNC
jgi:dTMP kinase